MSGSVEIKFEKGIEGLFGWPTTAVKTLEISPTTNTSDNPVKIAIGIKFNNDRFLLLFRLLKSLNTKFIVLLDMSLCKHNL